MASTKNTVQPAEEMSPQEMLAVIEKKIRSPRTKAAHFLLLEAKRAKLLKQLGRGQPDKDPPSESKDPRQRYLSTLTGEKREFWEAVYKAEDERRARVQGLPASPPMTLADVESFLCTKGVTCSAGWKSYLVGFTRAEVEAWYSKGAPDYPAPTKIEADVNGLAN